ncbi:DUF6745 domain-containing protein [uncultured Nostoc sp.]|uniref:DUF6745 domain-containing protein n=1 Tax=uncultured Nostoc sp. TaxID=340711 RepID=UPI0035CA48F8
MSLIEKLTPEQEALIPVYREKWRAIALSTERIDREKAANVVKAAYVAIGFEEPEVVFCDSPYAACNWMLKQLSSQFIDNYLNNEPNSLESLFSPHIFKELSIKLYQQLGKKVRKQFIYCFYGMANCLLNYEIYKGLIKKFYTQLNEEIEDKSWLIEVQVNNSFRLENHGNCMDLNDFCISVLNIAHHQQEWERFQSFIQECGWLFAYDDICIVCDRPLHLRFDNQDRLHAEGKPAIEFTDGYSLYSYHGVTLPEKYGKIHPQQWQSQWLLSEENAELRRVLIQGIGYARICQELQAIELDFWKEYTLLKIDNDVDEEPIYLLKMTCPSTGFIHALRVPPNMNSAREAIRWVNWGIDPEEFAVQT